MPETAVQRQQSAMHRLVLCGFDPLGAAAIVGNGCGESGPNLDSTFDRAHSDHGSGGFLEWRLSRKDELAKFADDLGSGMRDDLITQCNFAAYELRTKLPLRALNEQLITPAGRSLADLTANFCWIFERPAPATAGLDRRIRHAEGAFADWKQSRVVIPPVQSVPTEPIPMPPQPVPALPPVSVDDAKILAALRSFKQEYAVQVALYQRKEAAIDAAILALSNVTEGTNSMAFNTGNTPDDFRAAPRNIPLVATPAKPALASSGVWGGIIAVAGPLLLQILPTIAPAMAAAIPEPYGALVTSVIGGIMAIYGRVQASQPIKGVISAK
jgi:tail lysozyme